MLSQMASNKADPVKLLVNRTETRHDQGPDRSKPSEDRTVKKCVYLLVRAIEYGPSGWIDFRVWKHH
jgi:hypothetical protein